MMKRTLWYLKVAVLVMALFMVNGGYVSRAQDDGFLIEDGGEERGEMPRVPPPLPAPRAAPMSAFAPRKAVVDATCPTVVRPAVCAIKQLRSESVCQDS
jgi:hypothetical protein